MNPPIIHRDIKPENILIDKNGFVKLTDFGWSNYVNSNEIRSTYCGTPLYLAPEMIKEIGHDEHLDIWCIGVLIFELLTGEVPFKGEDLKSLNNNILNLKISWTKDINSVAKNLISKILKPDPKDRISLVEMLQHPFFKEKLNDDNLERFLLKPDSIKYPLFLINEYTVEYYDNVILEKFCKENNIPNIFKHNIQEDKLLINEQLPEEISEIDKNLILNNSNNIGDINNNINEPYSNLLKDYKKLNNDYNELLIAKKEQEEKLNEYISKFNLLQQEKENLIKECENTLSEKLKLKTQLEEAKQQLKLNAYLIENMKENKNNIEEQYSNKIIDEKNEEIKNLNEKIKILENEQKKFDEKENIKLKNEFNKEKENYELIIKVKDEEIQNLIKAKDNIKIQEGKKYESIIAKYEEITKEKDKEIEMLKLKNKKLNMINIFMKSKEDNNSKNI
jgi:serine/threonine protein kinase